MRADPRSPSRIGQDWPPAPDRVAMGGEMRRNPELSCFLYFARAAVSAASFSSIHPSHKLGYLMAKRKNENKKGTVCVAKKNCAKAKAFIQIISVLSDSWIYFFEIEKLG